MLPKKVVTYLGGVRHSPKKAQRSAARAAHKGPVGWKKMRVEVKVQRNYTGTYVARACVLGGKGEGRKCSTGLTGSTPTRAVQKALVELGRKLR